MTLSKFLTIECERYNVSPKITNIQNSIIFTFNTDFRYASIAIHPNNSTYCEMKYHENKYFKLYDKAKSTLFFRDENSKYIIIDDYLKHVLNFLYPEKYKNYFSFLREVI